jgi:hypothetical protein
LNYNKLRKRAGEVGGEREQDDYLPVIARNRKLADAGGTAVGLVKSRDLRRGRMA